MRTLRADAAAPSAGKRLTSHSQQQFARRCERFSPASVHNPLLRAPRLLGLSQRDLPRQRPGGALAWRCQPLAKRWWPAVVARAAGSGPAGTALRRQGRSVAQAKRPTPPSSTAAPSLTPPRPCLRGVQATPGLRTSSQKGTPVCAAARGPVSAAADTASPLDCPRARLGCQAAFLPPIGSATRSNSGCALPHQSAPLGAQR
jgi:hypothetical protein